MLQTINDKAKGIIGWIIIALISFTFALFGIADYVDNGPAPFAAKVNDSEISVRSYQEALSRQRQRLESMFGGQLPNDTAFENTIKQQVLEQLISRAVLDDRVSKAGYQVNDQMASEKIKSIESFQQDGQFTSAIYKQMLNAQGRSVAQFENDFRADMVVQQMQNAIMQSSITSNAELQKLNSLQLQIRDVSYLEIDNNKYTSNIKLTDEEVKQYYEQNSDRYMHPEQVSISYIEIKADDISSDIEVDEEAIRRQYDLYVVSIADNQQRKAKHILVQIDNGADDESQLTAKNKINDALIKLNSGSSFDELAKSISEDTGSASKGGDLGWINRGMMGDAFDDALFKLNKNEVSEVVQTSFGYHIIKLTDTKGETPKTYAEKKAELVKELKHQDVEKIFYDRSEVMATLAYENDDTLLPVADALQLSVNSSSLFSRASGNDIASNKAVRDAAFNSSVLKQGRNSEVIELDRNHIIVLRVDQHVNAKPKSLDLVRPALEMTLKASKARQKVQADGLQALADLQQGKSTQQVARDQQASLKNPGKIKRDDSTVDQAIVRESFKMNKPEAGNSEYKIVDLANGVAVIAINSVSVAETASKADELQLIAKDVEMKLANEEMSALINYLKSQAEIVESKNL